MFDLRPGPTARSGRVGVEDWQERKHKEDVSFGTTGVGKAAASRG